VSAIVRSIVVSGNTVYVAGGFGFISGQPRGNLGAIDATTGAVLANWTPTADATVQNMVQAPDGRIMVVGSFTTMNGTASQYLAALDPNTGALLPWANHPAEASEGIAVSPTRLFVGVGNGAGGNQVVSYDLATGVQQWVQTGDGDVVAVQYLNGVVYVGGHFDNMAGSPRGRLAAFDPATGALRADWTPTVNTTIAIVTMSSGGNRLYIGGAFTQVTGVGQQRFAQFSGAPAANTPPVVDSVLIDQTTPGTNDTLSATVTSHDADGNPVTYAYQWTKNGTDIPLATGATLNMSAAGAGDKADLIRVRVTANDGIANSAPLTSAPVTVTNTPPSATVSLSDHAPGTAATLTATATRADADATDTVGLTYVWTVNGTPKKTTVTTATTDTFDLSVAGNGDANDVIVLTVTPNDGTVDGAPASDTATVGSGATPPIFSVVFTNLNAWTPITRVTIDNATGSPAAPSARAQGSAQSAFAYHDLASTTMTACASVNVNVSVGAGIDLFRLRTAANGAIIKVARTAAGTLQIRSDFGSTTQNSGVQLGTGWHNVELCGTVGGATTWDLYRDGVKIVNAWAANTGTTPIGRVQIGDTAAGTFTVNFDHFVVDLVPGDAQQAPDTTGPTTPGQPTGSSPSVGSIQISWAASTDQTPPITYRIYRDANPISIGQTTATSFSDPGLAPGSSHTYTVDAVDALNNPSAMSPASASILVSSSNPPIFSDDFSSGNFSNWTSFTLLTIDNANGSPSVPSARAQVTNQSASAYRDLPSTMTTACASVNVNVSSGSGFDLFRLRTATNGAIIKVAMTPAGTLQIRSDFGATTQNSGVQLGTGWHNVELCGTVGSTSTWDLYRDGVKIVNAWAANTGTTPIGRIQIGDTVAKTFTANFDHVVLDLVVG